MEDDSGSTTSGLEMDFSKPAIHVIVGPCGSGKSVLASSLLYHAMKAKAFKSVIVFCAHEYNSFWTDMLPEHCVRLFSVSAVLEVFRKIKKVRKANPKAPLERHCLVFDDVQGLFARIKQLPEWNSCLISFRHAGLSLVFLGQYPTMCTTLMRSLVNTAYMFRASDLPAQKLLFGMTGSHFESFKEWQRAFLDATSQKYRCMVFKNHRDTKEESYSQFICDIPPKFKINCKENGL
jgi:ABC-type dipeptide/oligopeptide/nickel transport system ATPase component